MLTADCFRVLGITAARTSSHWFANMTIIQMIMQRTWWKHIQITFIFQKFLVFVLNVNIVGTIFFRAIHALN